MKEAKALIDFVLNAELKDSKVGEREKIDSKEAIVIGASYCIGETTPGKIMSTRVEDLEGEGPKKLVRLDKWELWVEQYIKDVIGGNTKALIDQAVGKIKEFNDSKKFVVPFELNSGAGRIEDNGMISGKITSVTHKIENGTNKTYLTIKFGSSMTKSKLIKYDIEDLDKTYLLGKGGYPKGSDIYKVSWYDTTALGFDGSGIMDAVEVVSGEEMTVIDRTGIRLFRYGGEISKYIGTWGGSRGVVMDRGKIVGYSPFLQFQTERVIEQYKRYLKWAGIYRVLGRTRRVEDNTNENTHNS
jgi:hypothetical protein